MKQWIEEQSKTASMVSVTYSAGMWDILITDGPLWCETRKRAQGKTFAETRKAIEGMRWRDSNLMVFMDQRKNTSPN